MHPALRGMRYCDNAIPSGPCGPVQEYPGCEIKRARTRSILTIQLPPAQKNIFLEDFIFLGLQYMQTFVHGARRAAFFESH
jgi:hypothetical protein